MVCVCSKSVLLPAKLTPTHTLSDRPMAWPDRRRRPRWARGLAAAALMLLLVLEAAARPEVCQSGTYECMYGPSVQGTPYTS